MTEKLEASWLFAKLGKSRYTLSNKERAFPNPKLTLQAFTLELAENVV